MAGIALVPLLLAWAALRRLLAGPRLQAGEAVFVYSQVTWDEVWQRPQQYAWLASRDTPVLYCCPVQLHNLLFLGKKWRGVRRFRDGRDLLVLSPLVFSGHFKSRWIHEVNCWITAAHVRLAIKSGVDTSGGVGTLAREGNRLRRGVGTPGGVGTLAREKNAQANFGRKVQLHILANTPFALRVVEHLTEGAGAPARRERLVFDVIDDFTAFEWSPDFGRQFDARLSAMADVVIAGTHELAAARPATEFVPCGVDFELFATSQPEPAELRGLPRPIIGYFGTISERIDLRLIERLAREFPTASVVMVGPVHFAAESLPRRDNLHYLGLRRHDEIPAFAQRFDVGLIPFRLTDATLKLNPVKTLEYLAAGVPVVATALPDLVRYYSDLIAISRSEDEFVTMLGRALAAPDEGRRRAGLKRARGASWEAMTDKINEALLANSKVRPLRDNSSDTVNAMNAVAAGGHQ